MKMIRIAAPLAAALAASPSLGKERGDVPEKYTWNLDDVFPTEIAWRAAREELKRRIPQVAGHRGHLGDSAGALLSALDALYGARELLERTYVYASMRSDEDTREARPREMKQELQQLAVDFEAATSWLRPELLALGPDKVKTFLAREPRLAPYRQPLDDVLRWKPHTLSAAEERVAAEAGNLSAGQSVYSVFKDADLPYPVVKLSTGEERVDQASFGLLRASPVREDRLAVFKAFFGAFSSFQRTLGTTLYAQVRAHLFEVKVRGFASSLEAALFRNAIPPAVYRQLVSDVRRSLPTLHRYLELRRRMLGLDQLRYEDLYVPLVASVDATYTPEEAMRLTLDAFAPLGAEYVAALEHGYASRWNDFLPTTGKRSGAYSTGVYGVHPYQLLNFNGKYDDVSTLAHESGHSMHTLLASKAQPYATADYAIFVAEVASTLNENLLLHHQLSRATDDATRLFLLGSWLDTLRATLFRQTLFAEFELAIHELAEKGETLTGENLSALYLRLSREYHGHDAKVCFVDDLVASEWSYIPHFYLDFYVYQYATSLVASTSIARAIREEAAHGGTKARDAYLGMLKAGGSKYPVELLRDAGVDVLTSAPFDAAMKEMNAIMDEIEGILARRKEQGPA
ncbi:MAG TPA: oligoendopeptidase F [Anaeromyxobacteraceae bacterium]|nr:oligoendopeptidase F [Anaeromyxobacteraceae bacterium]